MDSARTYQNPAALVAPDRVLFECRTARGRSWPPLTPASRVMHTTGPALMLTRKLTHADYLQIVSVIDHWWGGPTSALAHPLFFHELGEHALVAEDDSGMVGFLLGFINHTAPRVGYIHLVGIDPTHRRRGVGRTLYDEFTRAMLQAGVRRLKAITTPGNHGSIEFHKANGYDVTLVADYAGPGRDRYVFTRSLENQ